MAQTTPPMIASVTIYTGVSALWKGSRSIMAVPAIIAISVTTQPAGSFDRLSHGTSSTAMITVRISAP